VKKRKGRDANLNYLKYLGPFTSFEGRDHQQGKASPESEKKKGGLKDHQQPISFRKRPSGRKRERRKKTQNSIQLNTKDAHGRYEVSMAGSPAYRPGGLLGMRTDAENQERSEVSITKVRVRAFQRWLSACVHQGEQKPKGSEETKKTPDDISKAFHVSSPLTHQPPLGGSEGRFNIEKKAVRGKYDQTDHSRSFCPKKTHLKLIQIDPRKRTVHLSITEKHQNGPSLIELKDQNNKNNGG